MQGVFRAWRADFEQGAGLGRLQPELEEAVVQNPSAEKPVSTAASRDSGSGPQHPGQKQKLPALLSRSKGRKAASGRDHSSASQQEGSVASLTPPWEVAWISPSCARTSSTFSLAKPGSPLSSQGPPPPTLAPSPEQHSQPPGEQLAAGKSLGFCFRHDSAELIAVTGSPEVWS